MRDRAARRAREMVPLAALLQAYLIAQRVFGNEIAQATGTGAESRGAALALTSAAAHYNIVTVLIHGHRDLGGPPDTAWQLAQVRPDAELHLVRTGHAGGDEMTARILEATKMFSLATS